MPTVWTSRGGAAASICMLALCACSQGAERTTSTTAETPAAQAQAAPAPGTHRVVGKAPPAVSGLPSIIVLEPRERREFPAQADRPAMDQLTQTFVPGILFVRTGQPADFKNSDDVLHNVRVRNSD